MEEKYPEPPPEEEEEPIERQQIKDDCLNLYLTVEGRMLAHQAELRRAAAAASVADPVSVVGPTPAQAANKIKVGRDKIVNKLEEFGGS